MEFLIVIVCLFKIFWILYIFLQGSFVDSVNKLDYKDFKNSQKLGFFRVIESLLVFSSFLKESSNIILYFRSVQKEE